MQSQAVRWHTVSDWMTLGCYGNADVPRLVPNILDASPSKMGVRVDVLCRLRENSLRREVHIQHSQAGALDDLRSEVYSLQKELLQDRTKVGYHQGACVCAISPICVCVV